ncbi:hypothetical protein Agabi119p4_8468 [Agaricus bisporus var. burnettii]|uniref:RNase H type-1 domain-containing protein n=1 Tax=Agaricus bisporus var. burnettii TaxID=192524 RepID=A0A8H7C6N7_AGABI|nr:hypothetical protein Agabi119p4_8468 [Agaricus bisporus var. burnettii]
MLWVSRHIANSSGVHVLEARDWDPNSADLTFYTDACLTGLAFWIPSEKVGFCADVPTDRQIPSEWIFYREKWAVLSALDYAVTRLEMMDQKIVIYTDNSNTVDLYNTLHALPVHNQLLQNAVDLLVRSHCHLRVLHVPAEHNQVADALSRRDMERARRHEPKLIHLEFLPPRDTLGDDLQ